MSGIAGALGHAPHGVVPSMLGRMTHRQHAPPAVWHSEAVRMGCFESLGTSRNTGGAAESVPCRAVSGGNLMVVVDGFLTNGERLLDRHGTGNHEASHVLASLYRRMGPVHFGMLEGEFACAIGDGASIRLVRDQYGARPLYYYLAPDRKLLLFASEIKALLPHVAGPLTWTNELWGDMMIHGHPFGGITAVRDIHSVRPSSVVEAEIGADDVISLRELNLERAAESLDVDTRDPIDSVSRALRSAVDRCVATSRPVAVTLSGGLDSSVLALLAADQLGDRLWTVTLRPDTAKSEHEWARAVVSAVGSQHVEIELSPEDYLDAIPAIVWAREFPALSGASFFFLSRGILEGSVCLNGVGAGEVFGEENHYIDWPELRTRVQRRMNQAVDLGLAPSAAAWEAASAFVNAPSYGDFLIRWDPGVREWYLKPIDSCSRTWNVEARHPYYEAGLVGLMNRLKTQSSDSPFREIEKYALKRSAIRLFGDKAALPVLRPKQAMPDALESCIATFAEVCDSLLPDDYVTAHPYGKIFPAKHRLVVLDLFAYIFFERRGAGTEGLAIREFIRDLAAKTGSTHVHS